MSNDTGETLPTRVSDEDLSWAGLDEWQILYVSQASDDQREIVYREAIRLNMGESNSMPGLGL